ncbi:LPS export ABC transporter permease LptG [Enterovirga rhinocerotis]|uniref:Lipopolysaccharide export system permease protein n=1 Tax=Enterovirga rhinocerotis TaxID=1339210 RepID=A0A4R7BUR1_9HYPH|nr:LPS export ABC transporter permease LptG [Enterovirga rhinocerotis]TDR89241.1 lipopolysaccharide export system permease protein [Enterovirga rhinocerotis]
MLIGRTLGLYISARFLRTIMLVFATVFGLVFTLDFIELLRRAGDAAGATPLVMAQLSLYRTPSIAEQVLPFAVLFGSMATLLNLSRRLELVVARAAGISAWQFLQPGLAVAVALGIVSIFAFNPISASLKEQASRIEAKIFARKAKGLGPELWIRQKSLDGQAVIRAEAAVAATNTLTGIAIFVFDPDGRFVERVEAQDGVLREGYWEFHNARVSTTFDEPQTYSTYLLATNLDPSQVRQTFTPPESVSFWKLGETIARAESAGLDASRYRLQYDVLLARPLLFVAMVFLAASVSLRFFRFGGVAKMVLGGVGAGFVLYVVTEVMRDLGGAGIVGSWAAAWLPAIMGSLLGTLALLYQEDG